MKTQEDVGALANKLENLATKITKLSLYSTDEAMSELRAVNDEMEKLITDFKKEE